MAKAETKLRNLVEAVGAMGFSAALQAGITRTEEELAALRGLLKKQVARGGRVVEHPGKLAVYVRAYVQRLDQALAADDQERVRTALLEHMGPLTWTPKDGRYEWTGGLIFGAEMTTPGEGHSPGVIRSNGSGGRLCPAFTIPGSTIM
jgi:hypothetical protein